MQAHNKFFSWDNLRDERVGVFTFRRSAKEGAKSFFLGDRKVDWLDVAGEVF
jgi:hypothetical protein